MTTAWSVTTILDSTGRTRIELRIADPRRLRMLKHAWPTAWGGTVWTLDARRAQSLLAGLERVASGPPCVWAEWAAELREELAPLYAEMVLRDA